MWRKYKYVVCAGAIIALLAGAGDYLSRQNIEVLNPKGPVALQERDLIITVVLLMLIVVIPVFVLTFYISWKYRASNTTAATYRPDWDHSRILETIWWAIPSCLILILSIITWHSSYALSPTKQLVSSRPTMNIQVVALDWKWLFIYPKQDIATVNYIDIPINTPVNFEITADAPMNSFWIPQLGGQIYAMAGMTTNLNLMATSPGIFRGSSANISGQGFAGMEFFVRSESEQQYEAWVNSIKLRSQNLSTEAYRELSQPSINNTARFYSSSTPNLFDSIVMKYQPAGMDQMNMNQGTSQ